MDKAGRFESLDQLALEKARLDGVRKHHGARLERHWAALKDHEVRGLLLRDAASDMLRSWRPVRLIADIAGDGSMATALGAALFRKGGLFKRMFFFSTSLIIPYLVKRAGQLSMDDLMHHVKATVDRIRERMAQRETQEAPRDDE